MSEERTADYEIRSLERRSGEVQRAGLLTGARDALEDIDTTMSGLPVRLEEARTRGYVFESYLEDRVGAHEAQWQQTRERVQREIDHRVRDLESDLRRAETAMRRLQPYRGRSLSSAKGAIARVESDLASVERRVEAASDAVKGMFDALHSDIGETAAEIDACLELLDLIDQASFGFQPGECGVAAVKARWLKDGRKKGPKGIVFLTDRRIAFEQREKVAKKKLLFITTASEEVQELLWEAPIGTLQDADASEKRQALILKKERLALSFRHPAPVREVILELAADSESWRALINRVLSGDMDKERVEGAASAAQEAVVKVPAKCPSCGAGLDATVTKGMTAIKCAYCGTSVPLASG